MQQQMMTASLAQPCRLLEILEGGRGKGEQPGVLIVNFCWVYAVSLSGPYPIAIYSVVNQRPHLGHFWESVIFVIPIQSLFNSQSCNFHNIIFLLPNPENMWSHSSKFIKNATPSEPIQPWQCDTIQWHNPISLSLGSTPPPPPSSGFKYIACLNSLFADEPTSYCVLISCLLLTSPAPNKTMPMDRFKFKGSLDGKKILNIILTSTLLITFSNFL